MPSSDEHDELQAPTAITVLSSSTVEDAAQAEQLQVVVLGPGTFASYPLPEKADFNIGRSPRCEISISHNSISRLHAVLHVSDALTIEDMGSANGTMVRGERIERNQPTTFEIGELVGIGAANLVVQRRSSTEKARRLWTHDYFESRLEEECARSERSGAPFALLRLHIDQDISAASAQEIICEVLRRSDIVGVYSPLEYEVLLADLPASRSDETTRRLVAKLRDRGLRVKAMLACYPRDGRSPYALTSRLTAPGATSSATEATSEIVVRNAVMERLHRLVKQVSTSDMAVLLLGETGVGKEVFAHAIHQASARASRPFVEINCASLSETLLESELFGHEKGSFTSADSAKTGLLEAAQGGTVFLDEIGEMPLSTQAKLLRVIEDRHVRRVGATKQRAIDVRFVAATNRDLTACVASNTFRRDLYYRLNGVSIAIPPLRERLSEVEPLARTFAARACAQASRPVPDITPEALELLRSFVWPGNVRELRNMIERAVLLCGDAPISVEHLPAEMMRSTILTTGGGSTPRAYPTGDIPPLPPTPTIKPRGAHEERWIADALEQASGNQTKAANLLGISRRTLINRLEKYGLARPRKDKRKD